MTNKYLARSRNEHSTTLVQVIYNSSWANFFMSTTLVAEPYKCKLHTLQDLNKMLSNLYRMFKNPLWHMSSKLRTKYIIQRRQLPDTEYKVSTLSPCSTYTWKILPHHENRSTP